MIEEINGDIKIVKVFTLFLIKVLRYVADEIVYSFYSFLMSVERGLKKKYNELQNFLYKRKRDQILKDSNYNNMYVYIVTNINKHLFIHKNDLDIIVETEHIRHYKESNMLGFTSLLALEQWLENTKEKIYIIKQEDLDD